MRRPSWLESSGVHRLQSSCWYASLVRARVEALIVQAEALDGGAAAEGAPAEHGMRNVTHHLNFDSCLHTQLLHDHSP